MYNTIFKRKSIRKYKNTPLSDNKLSEIEEFIKNIKPLYNNINVEYEILGTNDVKSIIPIKAPHYLIISSENKDGYLENVGFMFQQLDLYLSKNGIGSLWYGMGKTKIVTKSKLDFVIVIAFGESAEPLYRNISEFTRKNINDIKTGDDERIKAAHVAPSATNSQPWYFVCDNGKIRCYCKKPSGLLANLYKEKNKIDMGIAICHLYISNESKFEFILENNVPNIKNYYYIGTVL